jgi:hypothetical protein
VTTIVETDTRLWVGSRAELLEGDKLVAWAEDHVRLDPDLGWILARYVEAENANDNGHIFPLEDLKAAQATLPFKPLNMLHHGHYNVGTLVAASLLYPTDELAAAAQTHPYIETLAAFWRSQFPEEYRLVERAHKEGALYISHECMPETVTCPTCDMTAAYAGKVSDTYCDHMNGITKPKRLNKPTFNAGGLIIPPVRPGWTGAEITELAQLIEERAAEAEAIYAALEQDLDHLSPKDWEAMMAQILKAAEGEHVMAKEFSPEQRKGLADKKKAMPGGGFPIENKSDLANAIKAYGRAKNKAAAKAHIIRRAKALGATDMLPEGWA